MDFSVPFTRNPIYTDLIDKAQELDIAFDDTRENFDKLVFFCNAYQEKRINIHCVSPLGVDPTIVKRLLAEVDNARWCLGPIDVSKMDFLHTLGAKYYCGPDISANNFHRLKSLIDAGATDVYLNDDLCYNLEVVSAYCKERNVRVRWILNRVQVTILNGVNYAVPFIRPNNIDDYSKYVDVGEFDLGDPEHYDFKTAKVCYKCWYEKKDWFGDLREIVPSLPFELYNAALPQGAFSRKMNCRLKCVSEGSPCNRCEIECNISSGLANKNIRFSKERRVTDGGISTERSDSE